MTSGIELIFESWGSTDGSPGKELMPSAGPTDKGPLPPAACSGARPTEVPTTFRPGVSPRRPGSCRPSLSIYDPRTPPSMAESMASPNMYHARAPSSTSASETALISEGGNEGTPTVLIRRGHGPRSSGSGSVDATFEGSHSATTPTRGPRDLSISALTEETA